MKTVTATLSSLEMLAEEAMEPIKKVSRDAVSLNEELRAAQEMMEKVIRSQEEDVAKYKKLFEDLMVKHKALLEDQKEKEKLLCLLEEVVVDGGPGTELRVAG